MALVLFGEPYKAVLNETPAKVLEHCIGIFENPTYIFRFHGNRFISTQIQKELENEIWQGCSSRAYDNFVRTVFLFLFLSVCNFG